MDAFHQRHEPSRLREERIGLIHSSHDIALARETFQASFDVVVGHLHQLMCDRHSTSAPAYGSPACSLNCGQTTILRGWGAAGKSTHRRIPGKESHLPIDQRLGALISHHRATRSALSIEQQTLRLRPSARRGLPNASVFVDQVVHACPTHGGAAQVHMDYIVM
jgi:hypothetical protein